MFFLVSSRSFVSHCYPIKSTASPRLFNQVADFILLQQTLFFILLGIEFYLFVSHGGMNDRGTTCKFRNSRSAFRNLHVDPLSFIPP